MSDTQAIDPVAVASSAASAAEPLAAMLPHGPIRIESGSLLRTTRLVLRPLRPSDRDAWIGLVRGSRTHLNAHAPLHQPGESDAALFDRQLELTRSAERTGEGWRRVAMLHDGRLVGGFNINAIRRGLQNEGDVNYWLGAAHEGLGLAAEAVGALVDFAFLDMPAGLGLQRLTASIKPGNDRSIRLAGRVGFERCSDGRFDRMRCAGGRWHAHDTYAIVPQLA